MLDLNGRHSCRGTIPSRGRRLRRHARAGCCSRWSPAGYASGAEAAAADTTLASSRPRSHDRRLTDTTMLFEKIRRTQKPVFIFLALIFGLGFVFLGVGSGAGGLNPLDFLNSSSRSSRSTTSTTRCGATRRTRPPGSHLAQAYAADGQTEPALGAYQQLPAAEAQRPGRAALRGRPVRAVGAGDGAEGLGLPAAAAGAAGHSDGRRHQPLKFSSSLPSPMMTNLTDAAAAAGAGVPDAGGDGLHRRSRCGSGVLKLDPTNSIYWRAMARTP